jgi:hypothetical protein
MRGPAAITGFHSTNGTFPGPWDHSRSVLRDRRLLVSRGPFGANPLPRSALLDGRLGELHQFVGDRVFEDWVHPPPGDVGGARCPGRSQRADADGVDQHTPPGLVHGDELFDLAAAVRGRLGQNGVPVRRRQHHDLAAGRSRPG